MPTADAFVRPARAEDAERLGEIQSAAWRQSYAGVLPAEALDELDPRLLGDRWADGIRMPPSPRHRVLVAVEAGAPVGFLALTPGEDPDLDAERDAELAVLVIDPAHTGAGHGSRLIAAAVEHLRGDGCQALYTWVTASDEDVRGFLERGGWAPDGAHRSLDLRGDGEVVVRQVRLHTDITAED